jgi:hypothetical protein
MVNCPLSAKVLRSAHGAWPPDVETSTSELAQRAQVRTGRFIRDRKSRNDPSRVSAFALHKRFLPDVMSYPGRGRKGTAVRKALPSICAGNTPGDTKSEPAFTKGSAGASALRRNNLRITSLNLGLAGHPFRLSLALARWYYRW